jgi:hypothetical protein
MKYNLTITTESAAGTDRLTFRNRTAEQAAKLERDRRAKAPKGSAVTVRVTEAK